MKILKFILVLFAISLVVFFIHFNNTKRVNPTVVNYYSNLKESLKKNGYANNLLVISTKRSKLENYIFENFSVASHDSRHLTNDAMDFLVGDINYDKKIDGKDVDIVSQILSDEIILNKGGIGTYKKQGLIARQMVHIDCREEKNNTMELLTKTKKLTILDLDNTLIYGTTTKHNLSANILFHFSKYLVIYERPYAKEFVKRCHTIGDVVVFTTAEKEYATKVCENLGIKYIELFTREDCLIFKGSCKKSVPDYYFDIYDSITIIDDLPEIWDKKSHEKCRIIGVGAFTGEVVDDELLKINF